MLGAEDEPLGVGVVQDREDLVLGVERGVRFDRGDSSLLVGTATDNFANDSGGTRGLSSDEGRDVDSGVVGESERSTDSGFS